MDLNAISSGFGGGGFNLNQIMKSAGMGNFNLENLDELNPEMMKSFIPDNFPKPTTAGELGNSINLPQSNTIAIGSNRGGGFAATLKELIADVNQMQIESGSMQESFVRGEPVELHDVMIASQKASTSFKLLLELRNKGLDLYREVSRMQ